MTPIRSLLLIFVLGTIVSCGSSFRVDKNAPAAESPWPYWRGDIHASGVKAAFATQPACSLLWLRELNDRPSGPLTIHFGALSYPSTKRKLRFINLNDGESDGYIRLKGVSSTGLTVSGEIGLVGLRHKRNLLVAIDLSSGKRLWSLPFKDAAAGTIMTEKGWIVSSSEGELLAIDVSNGTTAWRSQIASRLAVGATLANNLLLQPAQTGAVYAIDMNDGKEQYKFKTDDGVVVGVAVKDEVGYTADISGNLYAFSVLDGSLKWNIKIVNSIWGTPCVTASTVVAAGTDGDVVAVSTDGGAELWRYKTGKVIIAPPAVAGETIVVGAKTGDIYFLNLRNGALIHSEKLTGGITQGPVLDSGRALIATDMGRVACFGL